MFSLLRDVEMIVSGHAWAYLECWWWKHVSVIVVRYVIVGRGRSKMEFSLRQAGKRSSPQWQTVGNGDRAMQYGVYRWLFIRLFVSFNLQHSAQNDMM